MPRELGSVRASQLLGVCWGSPLKMHFALLKYGFLTFFTVPLYSPQKVFFFGQPNLCRIMLDIHTAMQVV